MPTEQQPEEAATKLPAAAASAAGSFAQTQMYGRGFRQRPNSTEPGRQPASGAQPVTGVAKAPSAGNGLGKAAVAPHTAPRDTERQNVDEAQKAGLQEQTPDEADAEVASWLAELGLDGPDPALEAESLSGAAPACVDSSAGADEPALSSEMLAACSAQDAAAARARLVQGQQLELPAVVPPAPGLAPGL